MHHYIISIDNHKQMSEKVLICNFEELLLNWQLFCCYVWKKPIDDEFKLNISRLNCMHLYVIPAVHNN